MGLPQWSLTHSCWGALEDDCDGQDDFQFACEQTWGRHYKVVEGESAYFVRQREERGLLLDNHKHWLVARSVENLVRHPPEYDSSLKSWALQHLIKELAKILERSKSLKYEEMQKVLDREGWELILNVDVPSKALIMVLEHTTNVLDVIQLLRIMGGNKVALLSTTQGLMEEIEEGVEKFPDFDQALTPFHEPGKLPPLEERKEIVRKIRARTLSRASMSSSRHASISSSVPPTIATASIPRSTTLSRALQSRPNPPAISEASEYSFVSSAGVSLSGPDPPLDPMAKEEEPLVSPHPANKKGKKKGHNKKKPQPASVTPSTPDAFSDEEESNVSSAKPTHIHTTQQSEESKMSTSKPAGISIGGQADGDSQIDDEGEWSTVTSKANRRKKDLAEVAAEKAAGRATKKAANQASSSKGKLGKAELPKKASTKSEKSRAVEPDNGFHFQEAEFPGLPTTQQVMHEKPGQSAPPTTPIMKSGHNPEATHTANTTSSSKKVFRSTSKISAVQASMAIPETPQSAITKVGGSTVSHSLGATIPSTSSSKPSTSPAGKDQQGSSSSMATGDSDNESVDSERTAVPDHNQVSSTSSRGRDRYDECNTACNPSSHHFREQTRALVSSFVSNPGNITINGEDAARLLGDHFPPGLTVHDHPNTNQFLQGNRKTMCTYCDSVILEKADGRQIPHQGALICSKCGPCSTIRYCSQACLLNDVNGHYHKCCMSSGKFPLDWSNVPQQYYTFIPSLDTFSESYSSHKSSERTRQSTYIANLFDHDVPDVRKKYFEKMWRTCPTPEWQRAMESIGAADKDAWGTFQESGDYFLFVDHDYIEGQCRLESAFEGPPGAYQNMAERMLNHKQRDGLCPATAIPLKVAREHRVLFNRLINACFVTNNALLVEYLWRWIRAELLQNQIYHKYCQKRRINRMDLFLLWTRQFEREFGLSEERQAVMFEEPTSYTFHPYLNEKLSLEDSRIRDLIYEIELYFPLLRAWRRFQPDRDELPEHKWARFRGEGFLPATRPNGEVVHVNNPQLPWNNGWHGMPTKDWRNWLLNEHIDQIRKALDQYLMNRNKLMVQTYWEHGLQVGYKWVVLRDGLEMTGLSHAQVLPQTLFNEGPHYRYQPESNIGESIPQQHYHPLQTGPPITAVNASATASRVVFKSQLNPTVPEFRSKSPPKHDAMPGGNGTATMNALRGANMATTTDTLRGGNRAATISTLRGANIATTTSTLRGGNGVAIIGGLQDVNGATTIGGLRGMNGATTTDALRVDNGAATIGGLQGVNRATTIGGPRVGSGAGTIDGLRDANGATAIMSSRQGPELQSHLPQKVAVQGTNMPANPWSRPLATNANYDEWVATSMNFVPMNPTVQASDSNLHARLKAANNSSKATADNEKAKKAEREKNLAQMRAQLEAAMKESHEEDKKSAARMEQAKDLVRVAKQEISEKGSTSLKHHVAHEERTAVEAPKAPKAAQAKNTDAKANNGGRKNGSPKKRSSPTKNGSHNNHRNNNNNNRKPGPKKN